MAPVTLYDIPTRTGKCWSLNPWKPRMVLNYKGIDYTTEFIEYPHIEPRLKELGLAPNDKNDPFYFTDYTCPAIRFDDGTILMESWNIVHEIEKRYPTPSLHLDDPVAGQVRAALGKIFPHLRADILPKIPRNILSPVSAEYFERTREQSFGKPLSQVEKDDGGDKAWKEAEGPIKEMADLLKKNGGPFFLGDKVSYGDFIFVAYLEFLGRVDPHLQERFLKMDPAFGKILEASREWLKRDD